MVSAAQGYSIVLWNRVLGVQVPSFTPFKHVIRVPRVSRAAVFVDR